MKDEQEKKINEFNNNAAIIYSAVYKNFSEAVHKLNRQRDENVFKLEAAKYGCALKEHLDQLVAKMLQASGPGSQDALHKGLTSRVDFYLQQFRHKWNAL